MRVTTKLENWLIDRGHCPSTWTDETLYADKAAELMVNGKLSAETFSELTKETYMSPDPTKVFNRDARIEVKAPSEQYNEVRYATKHAKTGQPIYDPIYQRECMSMSEGSKARAGLFLKHLARKAGVLSVPATEHEEVLLAEMCEKQAWCGKIGDEHFDYLGGDRRVKALIDDATSGGLEIVPIEFDADIVTFPLLTGELFPGVDLKPVPRGRRIEGGSISTPTLAWGGGDNTEISLFSTASMVAPIDTTIFTVDAAIEVGRDFLSDSPAAVGDTLVSLLGERLQAELDDVIASGNGTTQPQGIFVASGVSAVPSDNGNGGPPTLNDYETLMFTVGKQYRNRGMNPVFISNDVSYQRRTGIKVDPTSPGSINQLPVFGMTHNDYMSLGWPHKIQNDIPNERIAYGALKKYRLYRRLGFTVQWYMDGATLARKNLALLVVRGRFGGKVVDAGAFAKITDAQS